MIVTQSATNLFIHPPLISILFSILLIYGIIFLGEKILLLLPQTKISELPLLQRKTVAGCISISLISGFLYPIALYTQKSNNVFLLFSLILIIFGAISIAFEIRKKFYYVKLNNTLSELKNIFNRIKLILEASPINFIIFLLIIIYSFLALSPPTDADSLDYHLGVPIDFMRNGIWPFSPEWFHSRLAGAGEILISLGVSVGATEFGQLLQLFGLFVIGACIYGTANSNYKVILLLIFLISPPLIWLVSSSKPQLLPIALTSLSISIIISDKKNFENLYLLPPLFISTAALMKFNFALSGFIVFMIICYRLYRNFEKLIKFVIVSLIFFIVTFFPMVAWKTLNYGGNFYSNIFTLFVGNWPGYQNFYLALQTYRDSSLYFPISLFVNPFPSEWTSSLGVVLIITIILLVKLYVNKDEPKYIKLICIGIILLASISSLFGQHTGRFYLEPIAWILIAASKSKYLIQLFESKFLMTIIKIQAIIAILAGLCGLYLLIPAIFNILSREQVLKNTANGYFEMNHINQKLPVGSIILTNVRSKALSNHKTISLDWENYFNTPININNPYLFIIKQQGPSHILYKGNLYESPWLNCLADTNNIDQIQSKTATRNFFNKKISYSVYVASFNPNKLPGCYFE